MSDQREKDEERSRESGGGNTAEKKGRKKRNMKEKARKIEKREGSDREEEEGRGGHGKEGWRCGSVNRNRCREGFRRRQYFNRRQIYRPPRHPAIRNGRRACYVPLREVVSCLSRPPGCLPARRLRFVRHVSLRANLIFVRVSF